jgi:hypothetical protein
MSAVHSMDIKNRPDFNNFFPPGEGARQGG